MTTAGGNPGNGSAFSVNSDGSNFRLLHSFANDPSNGADPFGTFSFSSPTLYGMTLGGGSAASDGTVFKINTDGTGFGLIHAFMGGAGDGSSPLGSPVFSGATLYGMTSQGGTANLGTVFRVNSDGTGFSVVHSFNGGAGDGHFPAYSSLVVSGTSIYGMTAEGGSADQGAIFKMNTDGTGFTLLHAFVPSSGDGWDPLGSLVLSGSALYGMTKQGGGGAGTIFRINTDGTGYSRMHTFGGAGDGANPVGTLTVVGSTLFGTTPTGGADALGTLFGINTDGTGYNVLYSFTGGPNDGENPADVIFTGSAFYGMTAVGGGNNLGTIYSLTPIPEPSPLVLTAAAGAVGWVARRRRDMAAPPPR